MPIGLDVDHVKDTEQELSPALIAQDELPGSNVPEGAGATVTIAELLLVPAAPVQDIVYVLDVVSDPVENVPVVPEPPPYAETQDVALVELHETLELPVYPTDVGLAVTVTTGGAIQDVPDHAVPEVQAAEIEL